MFDSDSRAKIKADLKHNLQRRFVFTRESVTFIVSGALTYLVVMFFANYMANVASLMGVQPTKEAILRDTMFDLLPEFGTPLLTDIMDYIMFGATAVYVMIHPTPIFVFGLYLYSASVSYILRITTVATTSLPNPRIECERVVENLFTTITLHRCNDLIFSGHTIILIVGALIWVTDPPYSTWWFIGIQILMWAVALTGALIIIGARLHYTIDVQLSIYIVIGVWYTLRYFWRLYVLDKKRLRSVTHPKEYYEEQNRSSLPTNTKKE